MPRLISEGECLYCRKIFPKTSIHRHLQKHLAARTKDSTPGKSFLLKVETNPKWGSDPYFLSLWVDGEATLGDIDLFLRGIWLECCGHLSSFTRSGNKSRGGSMMNSFAMMELLMKGKVSDYEKLMENDNGEIPKSRKTKACLAGNVKLDYEYDFGSTTSLQLAVVEEYPAKADKKIVLLSRNEPLKMVCETCGKEPATQICSVCMGNAESAFCKKCAMQHAKSCGDYAAMPVVNSPRMGVCAYDGGDIDQARDRILTKR